MTEFTKYIDLVKRARQFATEAHKGVFRNGKDMNGNKLEYITHPIAVSRIVNKYRSNQPIQEDLTKSIIAASLLHDTIEDVEWVTNDVIRENFGDFVAFLVGQLTSNPDVIKKFGKESYLSSKMINMTDWGLYIKLADRLHNVSDVKTKLASGKESDIKWANKYREQTINILKAVEAGRNLWDIHKTLILEIRKCL